MIARPEFIGVPLIGILRGCPENHIPSILECVHRGGMTHLEITMNSRGAERQIADAVKHARGNLRIGAGTVTSRALLHRALKAGASFIVTPGLIREVISECVSLGVPVFPGAFSPTEILKAWESGATFVKVFPADVGGPAFIRTLKGPFPSIDLLPTGGVTPETLSEFLQAGAVGAGLGTPLFQRNRLEKEDWPWLEQQVRAFVGVYSRLRHPR